MSKDEVLTPEDLFAAKRAGGLIAEGRQALGWSQTMLAQQAGIAVETVKRWEQGRATHPQRPRTMHRLSELLNIPEPEFLMAWGYYFPAFMNEDGSISFEKLAAVRTLTQPAEQSEWNRIFLQLPPLYRQIVLRIARALIDEPAG